MKPFDFFRKKNNLERVSIPQDGIEAMLTTADIFYQQGDYTSAFAAYKKIVNMQPNARAQYNLASLYAQGKGTERSFIKGAYWFHQAALNGDAQAETLCQKCILDFIQNEITEATPKNLLDKMYTLSFALYPKGDNPRFVSEQLYGIGGQNFNKKQYVNAAKLFRAAAEYCNHGLAQNYLAVLYNAGEGVEKNDLAALYWFDRANDNAVAAANQDRQGLLNAYRDNSPPEEFIEILEQLAAACTNGTEDIPQDSEKAAYWRKLRDEMLSDNKEAAPAEKPAKREFTNEELNRAVVTHCAGLLGTPEWPKYTSFAISGTENIGRLKLDEYEPENTWSLLVSVKHRDHDRQYSNFVWFDDREVIIEKLHTQEGVEEILECVTLLSQKVDEYWAAN